MSPYVLVRTAAAVTCALALSAGGVLAAPDHSNLGVYGWYGGAPVNMFAVTPSFMGGDGPATATDKYPDMAVYLIGPINETSPFGPPREFDTKSGKKTLPPHMDVLTEMTTPSNKKDAIGYFVVPGPKANEDNVHARERPANGLPTGGLAYEILVGSEWVPLTSHAIIEYGIARGLLKTEYFDYGGLQWAAWPDDAPAGFAVDCTKSGLGPDPAKTQMVDFRTQ